MDPSEIPEIKYFCRQRNRIHAGRIAKTAAAAATFKSAEKSEKNFEMNRVIVSYFFF